MKMKMKIYLVSALVKHEKNDTISHRAKIIVENSKLLAIGKMAFSVLEEGYIIIDITASECTNEIKEMIDEVHLALCYNMLAL